LEESIDEHRCETEDKELNNAQVGGFFDSLHLCVAVAFDQKDTFHNYHWELFEVST
jgi:hypothetical protein